MSETWIARCRFDASADRMDNIGEALETVIEIDLDGWSVQIEPNQTTSTLEVYFSAPPDTDRIDVAAKEAAHLTGCRLIGLDIERIAQADWVARSLEHLPPQTVGRFYLFGGHHREPPPTGLIALQIDAGLAFGTGHHESTRGCLSAISLLSKSQRPRHILDVGTGSGVLAIAMARVWCRPVIGSDIDRDSVETAKANSKLNATGPLTHFCQADGVLNNQVAATGPFDLITANILARPLVAMAPDLARALSRRGTLILSGLLVSQENLVTSAHRRFGLVVTHRFIENSWVTLMFAFSGRQRRRRPVSRQNG